MTLFLPSALAQTSEYVSPRGSQKQVVEVQSDPAGTNELLDAWIADKKWTHIVTHRYSPGGGHSYYRYEIDCATMYGHHLGTGQTIEKVMLNRADPLVLPVTPKSKEESLYRAGCKAVGR